MSSRPRHLDALALDELAPGELHRLYLEIARDGFSLPVALPMLVLKGRRPGPTVVLTAAVHGDELNGIPVIHQLLHRTDPKTLRGTLVGVLVSNVPGFRARRRMLTTRHDLNHRMPGRAGGAYVENYAAQLIERVVRHGDMLFDLHTASRGRVNCLYVRADTDDTTAARMARLQRPQVILHDPPTDGTLRGAASALGIPALTLEIGDPQLFQPRFVRRALAGIRAVLGAERVIPRHKRAVELPEPLICRSSRWLYTQHGGLLTVETKVGAVLEAEEPYARMATIFGDPLHTYRAPVRGVVIGHSTDPVAPTGSRIIHLGVLDADSGEAASTDALDHHQ